MLHLKNRRSLTLIELLIALCVIFVLLGVFAIYANINLRIAREAALRNELINIRMSIEHYRIINGKLPENLFTLMNQEFTFRSSDDIIIRKKFLKPFKVDKQGYLLDPFMNRYSYSWEEGKVSSQTKGYESW